MKPTDFFINQKPVSISFYCPHCDFHVHIRWEDLDVPEYWGDDWGEVECPYCNNTVLLGDYDI